MAYIKHSQPTKTIQVFRHDYHAAGVLIIEFKAEALADDGNVYETDDHPTPASATNAAKRIQRRINRQHAKELAAYDAKQQAKERQS